MFPNAGKVGTEGGNVLCCVNGFVEGPLALAEGASIGSITFHALFLGFRIFLICKDGYNLAKDHEYKSCQLIKARVELFRSEMDYLQMICDQLNEGKLQAKMYVTYLTYKFHIK